MKISYIIRRFNGRQVITEPEFKWSYPTQEDAIEAIEAFCEKHNRTGSEFLIWTLATYEKPKVSAVKDSNPLIHDPLIRWEWVSQANATREASNSELRKQLDRYSHRNGETEPPTQEGEYWFRGRVLNRPVAQRVHVNTWRFGDGREELLISNPFLDDGNEMEMNKCDGRWWGPIVPPWEDR
jgi:hypothetical protein